MQRGNKNESSYEMSGHYPPTFTVSPQTLFPHTEAGNCHYIHLYLSIDCDRDNFSRQVIEDNKLSEQVASVESRPDKIST